MDRESPQAKKKRMRTGRALRGGSSDSVSSSDSSAEEVRAEIDTSDTNAATAMGRSPSSEEAFRSQVNSVRDRISDDLRQMMAEYQASKFS